VDALVYNPPVLFIAGIFALTAGLAMVLGHNIWSGGTLPVVVTLAGWSALLKGLLLLFLSPERAAEFFWGTLHYAQMFYLYAFVSFVLGAYLTYAGFKPRPANRNLRDQPSLAA
jgi:hypothetical protein